MGEGRVLGVVVLEVKGVGTGVVKARGAGCSQGPALDRS